MAKRVSAAVGLAVVILALLPGCAGSAPEVRTAEGICREIQARLATEPGVVSAHASFLHTAVNPGDASVQLEVDAGADKTALTDVATRMIWKSHLDPLRRVSVTIGKEPPTSYALPAQKSELEGRYGPRPYVDRPYDTGGIVATLAAVAAGLLVVLAALIGVPIVLWRRRRARSGVR